MVTGIDFQLQPSGKPIPEYPAPFISALLIIAIIAATIMTRRRRLANS
jgi:hypothetical protein